MEYKVFYGLLNEEYERVVEAEDDYQAYLIASKTLYDLVTTREYSKGAFMRVERINE